MMLDRLAREVEALLLASEDPLSVSRLAELTGSGEDSITAALDRIEASFREADHAITVVRLAGGYRLATERQMGPVVTQLFERSRPGKLSRAALETLAVVAYGQPCTRPAIESVRGVNCDSALRTLLERELIRISGRKEAPGRPLLYATTREFLEYFGLGDLDHLPRAEEIAELLGEREPDPAGEDLFREGADGEEGEDRRG